jgi:hypothetical protein
MAWRVLPCRGTVARGFAGESRASSKDRGGIRLEHRAFRYSGRGFAIEAESVVLNEIARGIDVKKDLLDLMAFKPQRLADPLPYMDESCFSA